MVAVGARWDDSSQNMRFIKARQRGLIDYVEVNYPIAANENPAEIGLPIYAHTSNNGLSSAAGIDMRVAAAVREGANSSGSPWVGEHLSWLSANDTGALGYILSPLFTREFAEVAVANTKMLRHFYGRPLALELGPVYGMRGDYESEMHFLADVALKADSAVILDVTHWTISNRNLQRDRLYALDALDTRRVVELHVAGIRKSSSAGLNFWHDAHGLPVGDDILDIVREIIPRLPSLRAVTLEHSMEGSEDDFIDSLERLARAVR